MSGHYVISRRHDGWAIAVDGSLLLICERKKMAIRVVRDAMNLTSAATAPEPDCAPAPEPAREAPAEYLIAIAS